MNAIVAVDQNWAIGKGGDQLIYLKEDLKRFRALTLGHPIVVGRKTLATFPGGKPLKGRDNLVLSQTAGFSVEGARVFGSVEALLKEVPQDAFVVGGSSVYAALLPWCERVYVTYLEAVFPGADTFFPNLDALGEWEIENEETPQAEAGFLYRYRTYRRK